MSIEQLPTAKNKMAIAARDLRDQLNAAIELQQLIAKITWAHYQALTEQGFTKEQALELCKRNPQ